MTCTTTDQFAKPDGLCPLGEKAYEALMAFFKKHDINYAACKTFYSPQEWKDRGEQYGKGSVLIICHDGGDAERVFNLDCGAYTLNEAVDEALDVVGLYAESCTCWYTAVYKA